MSQATLPTYFKAKKRKTTPPPSNPAKKMCPASPVKFIQKGMLSPVKVERRGEEVHKNGDKDKLRELLVKSGRLGDIKQLVGRLSKKPVEVTAKELKKTPSVSETNNDINNVHLEKTKKDAPEPAYKRFSSLLQSKPELPPASPKKSTRKEEKKDEPQQIALPHPYEVLLALFTATETISTLLKNRDETLTFTKLKRGVLQLVKSTNLKESHIGQFLTVLPGCYNVSRDKRELVVTFPVGFKPNLGSGGRKKEFREGLEVILRREHENFLSTLNPPLVVPQHLKVTRFHPKFRVDKVPTIPVHPLPEIPNERVLGAKELLERFHKLDRVPNNNEEIVLPEERKSDIDKLKGVSKALIDKIRIRQQQKTLQLLTTPTPLLHRQTLLKKLPPLVPLLRNIFTSENKPALPLDVVQDRIVHSLGGCQAITQELISLLLEIVPQWVQIIKVSGGDYLKLDKRVQVGEILEVIKCD